MVEDQPEYMATPGTCAKSAIDVDSLPNEVGTVLDNGDDCRQLTKGSELHLSSLSHSTMPALCKGVNITMPPNVNAYEAYPVALHMKQIPWDIQFVNGGAGIIVQAHSCQHEVFGNVETCTDCTETLKSGHLPGIISRLSVKIDENTIIVFWSRWTDRDHSS